jgi:hypothetical protein
MRGVVRMAQLWPWVCSVWKQGTRDLRFFWARLHEPHAEYGPYNRWTDISGIHRHRISVGKICYPYPTRYISVTRPDKTHGWIFLHVSMSTLPSLILRMISARQEEWPSLYDRGRVRSSAARPSWGLRMTWSFKGPFVHGSAWKPLGHNRGLCSVGWGCVQPPSTNGVTTFGSKTKKCV